MSSPVLVGAISILCPTAYADFRVGSLAMLYATASDFEALEITAVNVDGLEFASGVVKARPAGTVVLPLRFAYAKTTPAVPRYRTGLTRASIEFETIDNENMADTTGATIHGGKVLLDDPNFMDETLDEMWDRPVVVRDPGYGNPLQVSRADRSRLASRKRWELMTPAELWRVRRLLHAFSGSRVSFFVPTFRADLRLTQTIGIGATAFRVARTGYSDLIAARKPWGDVRLVKKDGTALTREIIDVTSDDDEDVLSIADPFDLVNPITVAQVHRIEFVTLSRIADDEARLRHYAGGETTIEINTKSVKA